VALRTDLHQHAWPVELLTQLAAREGRDGPRARRDGEGWILELPGEPASRLGEREIDLHRRAGALFAAGIDRALLVPPLAIGLDGLDPAESRELLAAWAAGARRFRTPEGSPFAVWAAVPAADPDPADLAAQLAAGAIGLALPAAALADAAALDRHGPLLEALARADRPLFVHPGPPAASPAARTAAPWRAAIADYPAQLLAAWATWLERGLREHPAVRVAFAALAGGAPLLLERLAARGGPVADARDERVAYDTSSFGPRALGAAALAVGAERLAFGSDRPVVAATDQHVPPIAGVERHGLTTVAAARLLGEPVPATAPAAPTPLPTALPEAA